MHIIVWLSMTASAVESRPALIDGWMVDRWTMEDGLRSDRIHDIAQTDDGFVWLASFDGLQRFDGDSFKSFPYTEHPVLSSNRIMDIHAAGEALWIITEEGVLVRYKDRQFVAWKPEQDIPGRAKQFVSSGSRSWVVWRTGGTRRAGLLSLESDEPVAWSPETVDFFVTAIEADPGGGLWLGGDELLHLPAAGGMASYALPSPARSLQQHDDRLWLALQDSGIATIEDGELQLIGEPFCARKVTVDPGGTLWAQGEERWHRLQGDHLEPAESAQRPVSYRLDQHLLSGGFLWRAVGSVVLRGDEPIVDLDGVLLVAFEDRDGNIWLGGDGVLQLRRASANPVNTRHPDGRQSIHQVAFGEDGAVWFSPQHTIFRISGDEEEYLSVTDRERTCAEVGLFCGIERVAWYRSPTGQLWGLNPKTGVRKGVDGPDIFLSQRSEEWPSTLLATPDGTVWIGTHADGLRRYDGETLTALHIRDGLPSERIRGLGLVGNDLWVATLDAGLCRLREGTQIDCLGKPQGLFDDALHSVSADVHGRLWMSSNRGVFYARLDELNAVLDGERAEVSCLGFTERDGMRNREVNGDLFPHIATDANNRLLYPTQDGAVIFDPGALAAPTPPPVYLESLHIDGVDHTAEALAGTVSVSRDQHDVVARWTAVELEWPEQLRFQHRLEGYSEGWTRLSEDRRATWSNLPPGEFRLDVVSRLAGGRSAPLSITIHRHPDFTETFWFPLSLGLLGVFLTGVGARLRGRQLQARQVELEAEVASRTHQLHEQKEKVLAQAKRLEHLDSVKTRFIANISHELRTPVTLIVGPLRALRTAEMAPDAQHTLAVVQRNADRLAGLIDQLLDIARLDSGGLPMRARPQDLAAFLRRTSERFTAAMAQKSVTFRLDLPEDAEKIYFDEEQIDRVTSNLLSNALKFTPEGGSITLSMATDSSDTAGGEARVSVRDSGIGISASEQVRLFERFYQVEQDDSRQYEGAGIGLALTRELILLHGGEITVHSVPQQGATFTFTLPLGVAHLRPEDIDLSAPAASAPEIAVPSTLPEAAEDDGERPLVLIVEDNPDMRAYLVAHFRPRYRIREADNGTAALTAIEGEMPAVVVSDVMMPGMDGLEMCRILREDPAKKNLPVMLVSAKSDERDRIAGLSVADDYLCKPFRMGELLARVHRLLRTRDSPAEQAQLDPEAAEAPEVPQVDRDFLSRLHGAVRDELATPKFSTTQLSKKLAMSARQLQREVLRLTGMSPASLIRQSRMEAAQKMLLEGQYSTIGEVAAAVGFSRTYFSRTYTAWAGHPPGNDLNTNR